MKKKLIICSILLFCFIILIVSCVHSSDKVATISVNTDSEYANTFHDLNLGILFDFDFTLYNADKSWVNLWVERYINGEKESLPLTQLSFGNSPNKVDKGHLGFGLINPNSEHTLIFLYVPSGRTQPSIIDKEHKMNILSSWDYAIGTEKVELKIGETKILAAYREKEGKSIRTFDLQDEDELNRMIEQHNVVLLLKIKIEEQEIIK